MVGRESQANTPLTPCGDLKNVEPQVLITGERMAKLALLAHLVNHLASALIVCGPKGIGKSVLLNLLQERYQETWAIYRLTGTADWDWPALQQELPTPNPTVHKPNIPLKRVVLIDDAGLMSPGIINHLIEHASATQINLVLALTPDELFIKNHTDPLIDDCHIIEIPPLSERQCGDFLQSLTAKSSNRELAKPGNEQSVTVIYRQSHGIPGILLSYVQTLQPVPARDRTLAILIAAVVILVIVALGIQWHSQIQSFISQLTGLYPNAANCP